MHAFSLTGLQVSLDAGILGEILKVGPQFVLLQEVTMAMYVEILRILAGWQVYRRLGC